MALVIDHIRPTSDIQIPTTSWMTDRSFGRHSHPHSSFLKVRNPYLKACKDGGGNKDKKKEVRQNTFCNISTKYSFIAWRL